MRFGATAHCIIGPGRCERDAGRSCRPPPATVIRAAMDETDFEGTLVLEKLAVIDKVDAFFEAIDADDLPRAASLMRSAGVDAEAIAIVLEKMAAADGEH